MSGAGDTSRADVCTAPLQALLYVLAPGACGEAQPTYACRSVRPPLVRTEPAGLAEAAVTLLLRQGSFCCKHSILGSYPCRGPPSQPNGSQGSEGSRDPGD